MFSRIFIQTIVFEVVNITFHVGSEYVYNVIDYGWGETCQNKWMWTVRIHCSCKIWNQAVFRFLLLDNFQLTNFLCVNCRYYIFGLLIKVECILLFFVSQGIRAELKALDPNLKMSINASSRIFFTFNNNFCCFKRNYCT